MNFAIVVLPFSALFLSFLGLTYRSSLLQATNTDTWQMFWMILLLWGQTPSRHDGTKLLQNLPFISQWSIQCVHGSTNLISLVESLTIWKLDVDTGPSSVIAIFPWSKDSLDVLWDGNLNAGEFVPAWQAMIVKWQGACAVGGFGRVVIYGHLPRLISIKLPDVRDFMTDINSC